MAQDKKKSGISAFGVITFLLALSSFIMSSAALFITYDNGRLLRNAQIVLDDLKSGMRDKRSSMFSSEEETARKKEAVEKGKSRESLKTRMDAIRSRFSDTLDYAETGGKIEEWKNDLETSQDKWRHLSREKFEELKRDLNQTAAALKDKAPDATLKLDALTDRIKTLLQDK